LTKKAAVVSKTPVDEPSYAQGKLFQRKRSANIELYSMLSVEFSN
jgi:hypothetical protein